ncbi:Flp pilus assembly protein CpaB [Litorimonas sp.]|uniref:Flp pilus assembly protein CpaB n=1 Tax=Litorimonas sp. TaxID=1892381 RepID=UPI003A87159F
MRLNTIITLGASAAFGLLAVFLARGWINSAVKKELGQTSSETVQQVKTIPTTPILVADIELAFGDVLTPDSVRLVEYPKDSVPDGAFTNLDTLLGEQGERVVLSTLTLNEPILGHKISGPNGKASLSARIRPGYRAVAVRVDDVSGVAGFVVPGDIVDVIYTREPESAANKRSNSSASNYVSDIILQNISVLGVDQNQSNKTAEANVARTVTLEVKNEDGQALNLAMEYGTLSLSLRGVGEIQPEKSQRVRLSDLGPMSAKSASLPRTQSSARKNTVPKKRDVAEITIFRDGPDVEETIEQLSVKKEAPKLMSASEEEPKLYSDLAGG